MSGVLVRLNQSENTRRATVSKGGRPLQFYSLFKRIFRRYLCDNFEFNNVRWPTPFFFATFFFGGIEKKKVAREF